MKHLEVRHHFLRDHVEKRDIKMRYIDTERQLADIFIKPLDVSYFATLWEKIDIYHPYNLIWRGLIFYLIYFVSFFSFVFPSRSPKLTLFHLFFFLLCYRVALAWWTCWPQFASALHTRLCCFSYGLLVCCACQDGKKYLFLLPSCDLSLTICSLLSVQWSISRAFFRTNISLVFV
jgi:hypothetical protein